MLEISRKFVFCKGLFQMYQMKRIVYRIKKAGSISNLRLQKEDIGTPENDEVIVKVHAIGLNFADIFALQGLYSATPDGSFIPGLEYAGEIIDAGKNVSDIKIGDRVLGVTRFGAYTDHIKINNKYVSKLPGGWSFEEGAAFPVQVLTAFYALVNLGNLQPGQTVLIHSAAGGVGIWANRIAKKLGALTIGVVGNANKLGTLKDEGYDKSMVRSGSFYDDALKISDGSKPDLVLECIGGRIFRDSYKLLNEQGRMIVYGAAHFGNSRPRPDKLVALIKFLRRPKIDPMLMMRENKSVMGFNLIWLFEKAELFQQSLEEIYTLQLKKPLIGHKFTFNNMPDALKLFQSGSTTGKVVITVDN